GLSCSRYLLCLSLHSYFSIFFFFQAEDGIRDFHVTGVQTCALPICQERDPGLQVARVPHVRVEARGLDAEPPGELRGRGPLEADLVGHLGPGPDQALRRQPHPGHAASLSPSGDLLSSLCIRLTPLGKRRPDGDTREPGHGAASPAPRTHRTEVESCRFLRYGALRSNERYEAHAATHLISLA